MSTTDQPRALPASETFGLGDLPLHDLDFNDWGQWGDGNWHFYTGNEMDGHRCIASVAPNPGHSPHFNGKVWEWEPNKELSG
jgi:hypothetical protein